MFVDSLNKMENIVKSNANLYWEQFNVIELVKKTPNAALGKLARFHEGEWWKVKVYHLTDKGWKVPKQWVS